jgi:hypothetical protein
MEFIAKDGDGQSKKVDVREFVLTQAEFEQQKARILNG